MSASDSSGPHTVHVVHPPRFAGMGIVVALLILSVVVAGAFLLFWQMDQGKPAPAAQSDVALLRERLASDEARLAALEAPKPDDGTKAALTQAQADLATLGARIAKLETSPDPQARRGSMPRTAASPISICGWRRSNMAPWAPTCRNVLPPSRPNRRRSPRASPISKSLDASVTMRHAAAELALANLVRASGTASAFTAELQAFAALMPNTPEAADLAAIARHGAPTEALLAARFPDAAAQALAAERAASAKTWLGRLWANLGNLVVVRRTGARQGQDSDAILARAGARLSAGDLDGAIAEAHGLTGCRPRRPQALARRGRGARRHRARHGGPGAPPGGAAGGAVIRLVGILIVAALIAIGIVWIADRQGELVFTLDAFEIHMSAAVAIALAVLFTLAVILLARLIATLVTSPAPSAPGSTRGACGAATTR